MSERPKGTYVLAVELERPTTIEVGALGELTFSAGAYAYVGSAFGPGGFARVERHEKTARGDHETRHWHIDYFLGCPETRLETTVYYPDSDRECELAMELPGEQRASFGASDCDCDGHLLSVPSGETLLEAARSSGGRLDPPVPGRKRD